MEILLFVSIIILNKTLHERTKTFNHLPCVLFYSLFTELGLLFIPTSYFRPSKGTVF